MSVQQIADLAWAGQHEQAIAAANAALKRKALADDERMTLLDLRSESYIAVGDLLHTQFRCPHFSSLLQ